MTVQHCPFELRVALDLDHRPVMCHVTKLVPKPVRNMISTYLVILEMILFYRTAANVASVLQLPLFTSLHCLWLHLNPLTATASSSSKDVD